MKLIKIADGARYKRYRLTICEPRVSDDVEQPTAEAEVAGNAPVTPCEPETDYEKIFQSVAQSIANRINTTGSNVFASWPFYVDFDISEQNRKEPLCQASIVIIGEGSGEPLVGPGQDDVQELESELSFICLKGCSVWTSYIGSVSLTIGMQCNASATEEEIQGKLLLLQSIVTQAYFSANDNRRLNDTPTLYMGGFQPC